MEGPHSFSVQNKPSERAHLVLAYGHVLVKLLDPGPVQLVVLHGVTKTEEGIDQQQASHVWALALPDKACTWSCRDACGTRRCATEGAPWACSDSRQTADFGFQHVIRALQQPSSYGTEHPRLGLVRGSGRRVVEDLGLKAAAERHRGLESWLLSELRHAAGSNTASNGRRKAIFGPVYFYPTSDKMQINDHKANGNGRQDVTQNACACAGAWLWLRGCVGIAVVHVYGYVPR